MTQVAFMPMDWHFLNLQAWQCLRVLLVMLQLPPYKKRGED